MPDQPEGDARSAGSSLDKVVWANWSLVDPTEFDTFNEEWMSWFPDGAPVGQGTLMASRNGAPASASRSA